jgi:peroxiredoxin
MGRTRQVEMLRSGQRAPEFKLPDTHGRSWTLSEITSRAPALLGFFKISCPVCQFAYPYIERIFRAVGQDRLQIFGISQDDAAATSKFIRQFHLSFPVLLDSSAAGYAASNAFGISSVPSLFVIERDGFISLASQGWVKRDIEEIGRKVAVGVFKQDEVVPEWKAG